MRARRQFICWAVLLVALAAAPVFAVDDALDAQSFRPDPFGGRYLGTEDTRVPDSLCYALGLYWNFADSPVELREDDAFESGVVDRVTSLNAAGSFGLVSWLALGADIPFHFARAKSLDDIENEGLQSAAMEDRTTVGDARALVKFRFLDPGTRVGRSGDDGLGDTADGRRGCFPRRRGRAFRRAPFRGEGSRWGPRGRERRLSRSPGARHSRRRRG
ncbi:MAG: hypothetical protein M5R36_13915 [Deltaproteobacteria bacterium]|nr:hypothetical protein [Deltaproteobacteria bacterium]